MSYRFTAELWTWEARREGGWTFVSVPVDVSEEIRADAARHPPAGFGSVRVTATIGTSTWHTSVFPGTDGRYALPVKKAIRRAEHIEAGDDVQVTLRVGDA